MAPTGTSLGGATGSPAGTIKSKNIGGGLRGVNVSNWGPEQLNLFKSAFSHLGPESFTSRLASGDQSQFEQLEAPALRQFSELQGGLASRFSGMGSGARRSSGFANTSNQAAADFAQQLQSQRMGIQKQAVGDLMDMINQLLGQRQFDTAIQPKSMSFLKQLALAGTQAGGEIGRGFLGSR